MTNLTSREYAEDIRKKISDNRTYQDPKHYGAVYYDKGDHGTAHISIIDQNGDAVSATSSINLLYGSINWLDILMKLNDFVALETE